MIKHVVSFRLKNRTPENRKDLRDRLMSLQGKVPSLRSIEAGVDVLNSERSYDVVLITTFDDLAGLEAYQKHPEHVKVAEYIAGIRDAAVAVDFEY